MKRDKMITLRVTLDELRLMTGASKFVGKSRQQWLLDIALKAAKDVQELSRSDDDYLSD